MDDLTAPIQVRSPFPRRELSACIDMLLAQLLLVIVALVPIPAVVAVGCEEIEGLAGFSFGEQGLDLLDCFCTHYNKGI